MKIFQKMQEKSTEIGSINGCVMGRRKSFLYMYMYIRPPIHTMNTVGMCDANVWLT